MISLMAVRLPLQLLRATPARCSPDSTCARKGEQNPAQDLFKL